MGRERFGFGLFGHHPFMGGRWNQEPRAKRGDIKFYILEVLQNKPSHGYEIIRSLEERWGGKYKPSPGSIYPTLQMLEEGGYLSSEQMDGKKVYTITESGKKLLEERGEFFHPEAETSGVNDIRVSAVKLAEAVGQAIKVGDSDTVTKISSILDKARKEIYILLAEL